LAVHHLCGIPLLGSRTQASLILILRNWDCSHPQMSNDPSTHRHEDGIKHNQSTYAPGTRAMPSKSHHGNERQPQTVQAYYHPAPRYPPQDNRIVNYSNTPTQALSPPVITKHEETLAQCGRENPQSSPTNIPNPHQSDHTSQASPPSLANRNPKKNAPPRQNNKPTTKSAKALSLTIPQRQHSPPTTSRSPCTPLIL